MKNKYGQTALHKAAMGSSLETVSVLLERGADVNIQDFQGSLFGPDNLVIGNTPLHLCASSGAKNSKEVSHLLLHRGAKNELENNTGSKSQLQLLQVPKASHVWTTE